jgi:hypothetical protein
MRNRKIEDLIWEHLDDPKNKELMQEISKFELTDSNLASQSEEFRILHHQLGNLQLEEIDHSFSSKMQSYILASLPSESKSNSTYLNRLIVIGMSFIAGLIYYASVLPASQTGPSNWLESWKINPLVLESIQLKPMEYPMDVNWSMYLILIVPLVLYSYEIIINQYSKWNKRLQGQLNILF